MEKYKYISITPAENGVILSYSECKKQSYKSDFDNVSIEDYKEVFSFEDAYKSIDRMIELVNQNEDSDMD
mgnify:CR=1 FL=1